MNHPIKSDMIDDPGKNKIAFLKVNSFYFRMLLLFILWNCITYNSFCQRITDMPSVSSGKDGKLIFKPDSIGNRIPDFSWCGYKASEKDIPAVPVKVIVPVLTGDATATLQSAIDYVSALPMDADGFRGAILLAKGDFKVSGRLVIRSSGVVLRGSGAGVPGTRLIATGSDRQTLIRVFGANDLITDPPVRILNAYLPVTSERIILENGRNFKEGEHVIVQRPSTRKWIQLLGMVEFGGETEWLGWKPGQRDIRWERKITHVEKDTVTIDIPLTTALDSSYGGGLLMKYRWPGRISNIGIENLTLLSEYDIVNSKDEQHCWSAITLENAEDCWVKQVGFLHFAGSAVAICETARRITVEDCISTFPVSETGGFRRNTFFTMGQQTLFQRLYAERGMHDFAAGFCAAGPNAFVQCESKLPFSFSGATDSWASGLLFDIVNVDGQNLCLKNRGQDGQGAGWTAANSMLWQCTASRIDCYQPPGAYNWTYGAWAQFSGNGIWMESNNHITPRSLFYAQLAERLGKNQEIYNDRYMPPPGNPTSSPSVQLASDLTLKAYVPVVTLKEWIENASLRSPVPLDTNNAMVWIPGNSLPAAPASVYPLEVSNGWLVFHGIGIVTGSRHEVPWWRGDARPYAVADAKPALTRYVPGRNGPGYTDELEDVTGWMNKNNKVALDHNYGLWYDRRRDDHERIRRGDGNVWPPFYELPFARSGQETAWDGLSKYDLSKYNHWYWERLKQFTQLASQKKLVLIHQHYFQHNILEAGAHWADFPWRPANNINNIPFPEPPPYAGDKRIFMDEQFYNIDNPVLREIHRSYIRKCLENFAENSNIIHLISAEFTGPLHFVRFWLDMIAEWQKETGKKPLIGLSTTKDVQDSILNNRDYSRIIDVIDIRYWSYRADGSLYAPPGGQHLAPRQHARLVSPGNRSFEAIYRGVLEYKQKFPDKAVIFSEGSYDLFPWAIFMAGGSLAPVPIVSDPGFIKAASRMKPVIAEGIPSGCYVLGNPSLGYIVLFRSKNKLSLDCSAVHQKLSLYRIDPLSGKVTGKGEKWKGGKDILLENDEDKEVILWLSTIFNN
jgi:hypothetical protein